MVELPVLNTKSIETTMRFPLLQPHRVLDFLFTETDLEIDQQNLVDYWKHLHEMNVPWASRFDATFVPIGIYGDEARYGVDFTINQDKITCIFLNICLWRPRSSRCSRWMLFSIASDRIAGPKTLHVVWQKIATSINLAFWGKDEHGKPIARNKRFVLAEIRGDQAWHHDVWRHKNWWKKREVCWQCDAVSSLRRGVGSLYYEIGDSASWQRTHVNTIGFLSHGCPEVPCDPASICGRYFCNLL